MKKLLTVLMLVFSLPLAFAADAANDVVLSQRKADNSGFIQRNVTAVANSPIGFNTTSVPVVLTAFTNDVVTGAAGITAGGTNQNVTITPSGTGNITLGGTTGGVRLPSTNTAGLQLYNTADQTTNYERASAQWVGNSFYIGTTNAGSGVSTRDISLVSAVSGAAIGSGNNRRITVTASNPFIVLNTGQNSGATSGSLISMVTGSSAPSGTIASVFLTPTYNQTGGSTAANTDLKIERTETAVGSGAQYLIQAGTAALGNQFTVGSRGAIVSSVQSLSGAGAVNVTQAHTDYTSTGDAQALTLADGTAGQTKTICHVTDGGSGVLTPTTKTGFSTITFTNAGDSVTLRYTSAGWAIIGIYGAVAS